MENKRVKLKTINPFITCHLCKGYFIDATTITECLHTFCKSCLVKYLETKRTCPRCDELIHQSHPLQYVCIDRTMQDIVDKIVPDLESDERKRREKFYRARGVKLEDVMPELNKKAASLEISAPTVPADTSGDHHRSDEQINLCLFTDNAKALDQIERRFIRCSAHATVTHLKKYLGTVLKNDPSMFKDLEILCNKEPMGKDHSLNFILKTRWRTKEPPLELYYRKRKDV